MGYDTTLHNALCYMYDKPDLQYNQLVIAVRKAETETPGSAEVRAKSAIGEVDSQSKIASSDSP